jgi:glycosyltransferase involved in cell wall biosynthesis
MNFSFACTVFNEEKNLPSFLDSILNQSIKPEEIIIVDGGSKDKTVEIIKEYKKKSKIPIKLIVIPGANIAKGRNTYVKESKNDLLFTGDAGTRFEKDWIKKLSKGFEKGADVVVGGYYPEPQKKLIEKIVASRFPNFLKFSEKDWENFLPSNRQIAYKLSSWNKLGKFPEQIGRSDDTLLHMKAKKEGLKYYYAKDAKVYWRARENLREYLRLAYEDSVSDGEIGIVWKRNIYYLELAVLLSSVPFVFLSLLYKLPLFLIWCLGPFLIFLKEGLRIFLKIRDSRSFFYGGIVMNLLFFSHAIGALIGIMHRFIKKY